MRENKWGALIRNNKDIDFGGSVKEKFWLSQEAIMIAYPLSESIL